VLVATGQDLRLYYRQAADGVSKIYLVGANPNARLAGEPNVNGEAPGRTPQALLLLPKPGQPIYPLELTEGVRICNVEGASPGCPKLQTLDGDPFKPPFIEVTTTPQAEDLLNAYPGIWSQGQRFEAILTIKNLWVNGVPTTQSLAIPSTLSLSFEEGDSIYEDGKVTFRVLYVPSLYEQEIGTKEFWTLRGAPAGVDLDGVSKFDAASRNLTFYLPRMVRQPDTALSFQPAKDRVFRVENERFERTKSRTEAIRPLNNNEVNALETERANRIDSVAAQSFPYKTRTIFGRQARPAATNPTPAQTRPFKTNAPVISQDLPVFLRGTYTNNRQKSTGRHVFNIEASFAANNDFSLPPIWQNTLNQFIVTPHLKLDVNTARTLDNPNSIVWSLPVTFRHYFPGKVDAADPTLYTPPRLRLISITSGLQGEHSGYGQSQNVLIPVKALLRYSTRPGAWRFAFDVNGGPEFGHSLTEAIERIALEDPELVENPATFVRKLSVPNRNIRRLAGEAKMNLTQGKKVSLQAQFHYRKLYRDEQYIKEREVTGTFTPGTGQDFFGLGAVPHIYTVLDTGFDKRLRRYGEITFEYSFTDNFALELVYKRGVKPPTFQMVNMVSVGFSFSLGKPAE